MDESRISRRGVLAQLGGLAAVAVGGTMWKSDADGAGPEAVASGRYRNGGSRSVLWLTRSGAGYVASLTMGVHRS